MVHCPDYEEFTNLVRRVEKLETENKMLKSLLLGQQWLSRKQAMKAIGCSSSTLKRIANEKELVYRYVGKHPFYDVDSIRTYLKEQKIDENVADERVLRAALMA